MGSSSFEACMLISIVLLCLRAGLALWLSNLVMGPAP